MEGRPLEGHPECALAPGGGEGGQPARGLCSSPSPGGREPWGRPAWPEAACVSAEVAEAACWLALVPLSVSSGQTFKPEFLPRGAWR